MIGCIRTSRGRDYPLQIISSSIFYYYCTYVFVHNEKYYPRYSKGRRQNSLPLTTNFSQKLTQPSKGISYPVGDLADVSQNKLCPLPIHHYSNPIPPTDGTNGLLCIVAYMSPTCYKYFSSMFLSSYFGEF